ncbi:GNAT family N-acetyltransferase [Paenibacillus sp. JCM 10914]
MNRLKPEDYAELLAESLSEGHRHIRRLIDDYSTGQNRFEHPDEALFEYRIDGMLTGVCGLNRDPYSDECSGRVRRMYVLNAYRRQGIGRALLEAVIDESSRHYRRLVLNTGSAQADLFYARLGFTRLDSQEHATHVLEF